LEKFAMLEEAKTNVFEAALYQSVRAALAAGQPNAATNSLARLITWHPKGFHTERAVLFAGLQLSQERKPAEARKMFLDWVAAAPESKLLPEVRLAIARTFEEQEKWPEAIEQYDSWLANYTNHGARASAMYYQARANFFAHRETNAFA